MIAIEDQFVIPKPINDVWQFFDDFEGLAACVPTLKEFRIEGDNIIEGKVGVTLGAIPVTSKVRLEVAAKRAPECIMAHGVSYLGETIATQLAKDVTKYRSDDTGRLYLHLDLRPEGPTATRVLICAGVEAEGKLRKIYESIMRLKVPTMKKEFQEKIGRALATECQPRAEPYAMCKAIEEVKATIETGTLISPRSETHAPSKWASLWSRVTTWLRKIFGR